MSVTVQWLNHASFKITNDLTIYIDPWKLPDAPHDASVVLVSHSHYDHFNQEDIEKVSAGDTQFLAPADVPFGLPNSRVIAPGGSLDLAGATVQAIAVYNPSKDFHPQVNSWVGFVIEIESKRIYYAGDTDLIAEMDALGRIDLALLPVGGIYTMNAGEAAAAVKRIKPACAIPYHWGDIVGSSSNAQHFAEQADCPVTLLRPGQSLTL